MLGLKSDVRTNVEKLVMSNVMHIGRGYTKRKIQSSDLVIGPSEVVFYEVT